MEAKNTQKSSDSFPDIFREGDMMRSKSVTGCYRYRVFLVRADVSQLKEQCTGEAGEKLAETILQNSRFRLKL